MDTKKLTKGADKKSYVGTKPTIKESVYINNAKIYQANLSPPDKKGYQGVAPHVGGDDYIVSAYRDVKDSLQAMSRGMFSVRKARPTLPPDSVLVEHARRLEASKSPGDGKGTRWPFAGGFLSTRRGPRGGPGEVVPL